MDILRSKYVESIVLVDHTGTAVVDIERYARGLMEARTRYLEMAYFMKHHNWHIPADDPAGERTLLNDVSATFSKTVEDIDSEIIDLREHFK